MIIFRGCIFHQLSLYQRNSIHYHVIFFPRVDNLLPLEGMCCDPGTYSILSYSSRQVKVWYIMQLYSQAGNIGSPCTNLQVTSHPLIPIRILAACADSAVRMVSPITGEVLTTALLPVERKIASMCYLPFEGKQWLRNGNFKLHTGWLSISMW